MNYRNYEGKIVEKYGVELKGWPSSKSGICNPATLGGRQQLEKLLAALESGQCHWVVLTEDELEERKKNNQAREERGEQVYRPRKSANHKSNPKGAKSAETIEDDEEEEEEAHQSATKRAHNGDEDEGEQEHSAKRSRTDSHGEDDGEDQDIADNADISGDNTDYRDDAANDKANATIAAQGLEDNPDDVATI